MYMITDNSNKEPAFSTQEESAALKNLSAALEHMIDLTNRVDKTDKSISLKRKTDKHTDLGEVLKDNPLRVFVQRTTRRTVAPRAGGFRFHVIKTPAPVYLFTNGYDPDFKKKKQKREDDITMIKAQIEYAKLREQAGTKLGHRRQ